MVDGKIDLKDLIISKTLRASYKNPSQIAHKVLARRMGERDAGNKPQANDRIPYVYIKTNTESKLQGDRIENPDYIRENNLVPDYYHYITNQLLNPICQMFALCVTKLPGYSFADSYWEQMDVELAANARYKDDVKRKDRIQALKEREVECLLFSEYLNKLCPEKAIKATRKKAVHLLDKPVVNNPVASPKTILYTLHIECAKCSKKDLPKDEKSASASAGASASTSTSRMCYNVTMKLMDGSNEDKEVWSTVQTFNQKKNIALVHGAEFAFKDIYTSFFQNTDNALHIITDKVFVKTWKTIFNTFENQIEKYKVAVKSGDIGVMKDFEEIIIMENIIRFHDVVPYTIAA